MLGATGEDPDGWEREGRIESRMSLMDGKLEVDDVYKAWSMKLAVGVGCVSVGSGGVNKLLIMRRSS